MSRVLAASVDVGGKVYEAGTTPPADVAEKITNDAAWQGEAPAAEPTASAIPPKGGAGSGKDAWASYAEGQRDAAGAPVVIPEDASRDDIIAALEAAGVPTEQ